MTTFEGTLESWFEGTEPGKIEINEVNLLAKHPAESPEKLWPQPEHNTNYGNQLFYREEET